MDLGYMVQSPTPNPPPEFQPPRNASLAHARWDREVIDKKNFRRIRPAKAFTPRAQTQGLSQLGNSVGSSGEKTHNVLKPTSRGVPRDGIAPSLDLRVMSNSRGIQELSSRPPGSPNKLQRKKSPRVHHTWYLHRDSRRGSPFLFCIVAWCFTTAKCALFAAESIGVSQHPQLRLGSGSTGHKSRCNCPRWSV